MVNVWSIAKMYRAVSQQSAIFAWHVVPRQSRPGGAHSRYVLHTMERGLVGPNNGRTRWWSALLPRPSCHCFNWPAFSMSCFWKGTCTQLYGYWEGWWTFTDGAVFSHDHLGHFQLTSFFICPTLLTLLGTSLVCKTSVGNKKVSFDVDVF